MTAPGPSGAGDDARQGDPLDVPTVAAELDTAWLGRRHIHVDTCASTNDLAAAEARAGAPEGLVVTASEQTVGRGRMGRVWHSPPGANLYVSLLLRPQRSASEIPPVTLMAGGAVAVALRALGFDARVKWPNDLLLSADGRPRKVAGILTEASTEGSRIGHVVVGIGVNVNATTFPDDIADKATSLRLVRGAPVPRVEVLARLLSTFESAYERFQVQGPSAAIDLWTSHAALGTRCRVRANGHDVTGVTAGVAPDGALLIRDDADVIHRVVSGEITT